MKEADADNSSRSPDNDAGRTTLDWAVEAGLSGEVLRELGARRRRRRVNALGVVAAVLVAAAVVWQMPFAARVQGPGAPTAVVIQPQRQVLPDGSVAELKAGALIRVEFSEAVRRVVLERGEAHFTVTKNPARPFVVAAGRLEVRAVGTAFAVDLGATMIEVVVTEGRVAVNPAVAVLPPVGAPVTPPTFVEAGQRVLVDEIQLRPDAPGWPVDQLAAAELAETQAWRVPRLEFSGTPLAEALPLFNRHSPVRLVLDDPVLGRLRLSGLIRADNTDALLRLLEANFGITAERSNPNEIRLRQVR